MANIIAFPSKPTAEQRYREDCVVGVEAGIRVRLLSRIGTPHDLLIAIDGSCAGTTVASFPAEEVVAAEVTAHAILASLEAARNAWRFDQGGSEQGRSLP